MRGHFFRRIGCIFLFLMLFAFGAFTILFWLVASASGVVNLSESVLAAMRTVGIVIALLVLAGILFGGRELRRTALPIGDMLEAAGRIADGDYSTRVDERGPREVRALARAFNTMAARLQAEDEQRRNLLADVSHELRTPITVIQGNLEGLLDGIYPADQQHIAPILEETRVLSRVIDDLRTLSLADSGALKLQLESTNLEELIEEAVTSFRLQAGASGVELRVDVQAGLPRLEVDPTRIREVLVNLLANALRYTPSDGQIVVHFWLDEGDGERVYVSVKDTGVGIAAQDLLHIFERFYKTDESRGTGLGLAIARSLVAAHGGEISAESEVGVGTKILFTLPVEGMKAR
jgi:two-component system OmpR family sensor kinase/two-component system sensor histidine kinase BaeS